MINLKLEDKDAKIILNALYVSLNKGGMSVEDYCRVKGLFPVVTTEPSKCGHEACEG